MEEYSYNGKHNGRVSSYNGRVKWKSSHTIEECNGNEVSFLNLK